MDVAPAEHPTPPPSISEEDEGTDLEEEGTGILRGRRGRRRGGRARRSATGRYVMVVSVRPEATQVAILEGRTLLRHHVASQADSDTQIDGNIYLGRVQNVLPGMEAAFIDIGTPKNAVLYQGDLRSERISAEMDDAEQVGGSAGKRRDSRTGRTTMRIEQVLRPGQMIVCQVTKNPIGAKGARLTQEVSLPGRFVVLVPGNDTYGISKRLPDDERRRLRQILDRVRPQGHGLIVRTAAEGASEEELRHDVSMLVGMWEKIEALARRTSEPALLYKEPNMALRLIREEFNRDFRAVYIDDRGLWEKVYNYVGSISPDLMGRVQFYDREREQLPVFERFHVHEQLHKALERKVWLASGGSIVIDRAEALTVIDVNTGKHVGTSNLEETVFKTNLEAADEVARQLQLRDIGGIIVIDFIDMEVKANREAVMRAFREALSRDKTRTQAFDMSELCLVEMTRKRVSEGLVESLSKPCPHCAGRGILFDEALVGG
jgi:ribonuclease E